MNQRSKVERLLADICYQSFRHEVQVWKDAPGTDAERLRKILTLAREALSLVRHPIQGGTDGQ